MKCSSTFKFRDSSDHTQGIKLHKTFIQWFPWLQQPHRQFSNIASACQHIMSLYLRCNKGNVAITFIKSQFSRTFRWFFNPFTVDGRRHFVSDQNTNHRLRFWKDPNLDQGVTVSLQNLTLCCTGVSMALPGHFFAILLWQGWTLIVQIRGVRM